ncbi:response regulator transcription factor [Caproiciproducens sp. CPB-2]|uniref:response regulator transcription factor n=1 Tax=Caproiciproducens sp. CPB-2 TaxID=3030017 RepID=UPI0023DAC1E8|nr:response regulator transcription factor [Caproiciproducens sp. CPB-2]MDF1495421.1 response regulator transcription factor [Caproiciproducens sp. CPB-2]
MRVLIVDDDRLVSSSLKTILEADGDIEVVGTGASGSQAIALFGECRPDILLMDIRMDGMTGIEVAEILLKRDPGTKILFLTTFSDDDYIIKALRIGAKGYLLKQNFESIVPSIKTVAIGQRVFGDEIITRIPAMLSGSPKDDFKEFGLSEKETEIITQVANGLSNKEIAETLFLSEGTVRNYISVILEKLGLRDRTQLAIFYYKHS